MSPETVFECWVPAGGAWSLWARPVLFAQMRCAEGGSEEASWLTLDVSWAPPAGTAVLVIDLPGQESVLTGLALAGRGYRPVPSYNVCTGPNEAIDQGPILRGLCAGAPYLAGLALAADAPPAFLLDARRLSPAREIRPGVFDNRWKVFPQDFPSGRLLAGRFTRVVLVQRGRRQPSEDLAHVLRRWQEAGLAIEAKDVADAAPPAPLAVDRPAWYRRAWYRAVTALGLRRCGRGGFGGVVPEPGRSHG
jgi:hypothetical protein